MTAETVQVDPPQPARRRTRSALRLGWGVADQAVSSISNFLLGVFVAKTLGAELLGAFSLAYVTYSVILNGSRGVATDPLVVRFSGPPNARWRQAVAAASGTALAVGVVAGLASIAVGAVLWAVVQPAAVGIAFVALGIGLPGLLVQDSWRFAFFSSGRGSGALVNDLVWTGLMVSALIASELTGRSGIGLAMLIFGLTATAAAVVGLLQTRVMPRPMQSREWTTQNLHLGPRYLIENVTNSGASQVRAFVLGAVAGLIPVGEVRGAEMLVGPFLVVLFGVGQVAVPEARRAMLRGASQLLRFCLLTGVVLAGLSLLWGAAVLVLLPLGLGEALLGPVWPGAQPLAPGVIVTVTAACFAVGATSGLRALGQARRSLRAQLTTTVLYLGASCGGAVVAGAMGAVWGAALARIASSGIWWVHLGRGVREGPEESVMEQSDMAAPKSPEPDQQAGPTADQQATQGRAERANLGPDRTASSPRLTIGLPTHNGERYLREALECLLAQTYRDFQLVISDNASTDATERICAEFAARDPRVRYVRQPHNIGAAANHNFVVEQARGELFKWASDDDLYHHDLVRQCVNLLDENPDAVCAHSMDAFVDVDGRIIQNNPYLLDTSATSPVQRFRSLLYGRGGNDVYGVLRLSVLRAMHSHGSYHNADRVLVGEMSLYGRFVHSADVLYFRRDHPARSERAVGETRSRAGNLDPVRLAQSRIRLYLEYVNGYLAAIQRAPLPAHQKMLCAAHLAGYVVSRLLPFHEVGDLHSHDPAVRDRASRATTVRLWTKIFGIPAAPSVDESTAGTRPVLG